MQYRTDKKGNKISILGYGCMRFTTKAGAIDIDKAEKEIMTAYEKGVNYFDTAYIYPGSENALGQILRRNGIRDNVNIATKLPHYMMKNPGDMDKYFNEELKRLRTDHVDYYLIHMLTDVKTWDRLCAMGIKEWIEGKMKSGRIRQIGFSYHGNSDMFCRLIDRYDWDFCQIQYNYLDENSQAGKTGLHYAADKGIPVVIMEPLRGGKLVNNLPEKAKELFANYPIKRTPAAWSFAWLWNQKEVACVLSGMNSMEMVKENAEIADAAKADSFTREDFDLLRQVIRAINANTKVGCTGCRYCMSCPKNVDIPGTFSAYNRIAVDGKLMAMKEYFMCTGMRNRYTGPANCIECGKCELHCPQGIEIRKELKNAKKALETPLYKVVKKLAPLFIKY